ncbi:MAG TPA: SpoIID/LytB domain-containing protein [Pyrinomonadaceae bacterium]|jgi:stage II sporulation protein D
MRPTEKRTNALALLCAWLLACAPLARAQTTRPRRVNVNDADTTTRTPATNNTTTNSTTNTNSPTTDTPGPARNTAGPASGGAAGITTAPLALARLTSEPTIRVGLATGARAVNISTSAAALSVSTGVTDDAPPQPLTTARVRVEPRVFGPLPASPADELFRVEIAGLESATAAAATAREVRELVGGEPDTAHDAVTNTWRVRAAAPAPREEAEELRARLEEAGYAGVSVVSANAVSSAPNAAARGATNNTANGTTSNATNNPANSTTRGLGQRAGGVVPVSDKSGTANNGHGAVRLAASVSAPTRGLVVLAAGATPVLDARTPVTFASADEQTAPVRFNERPYRGRIEVFTNTRGALTVVNVISLEDYVRGVVPNELSPGGWPALEALKAQAVAARTYAVSHRGQFAAEGFDVLPTTRSQVYGGAATEHPLATRAVAETRGLVATYRGAPIDALYTSTCGGRTEDAEQIFGAHVPYLRGQECGETPELAHAAFAQFTLQTARTPAALQSAEHLQSARDAALLAVHGLRLLVQLTDDWLADAVSLAEARALIALVGQLARRPTVNNLAGDVTRAPAFASALALALDGESRADVLLDAADVSYLLAFRDAEDIPAANRADVALLLRDGHLSLYPDATLRPRQALTRARALHAVAHALEARGLFQLQRTTARPSANGTLITRPAKGAERALTLAPDAYLFRAFGETLYPVRAVQLVGGEPVALHADTSGAVDYLEVRPAPNGAASDRFSPFANWTTTLSAAEVARRLARSAGSVGALTDLRVAARGSSRRVTDLEVVGTSATAHVRGGRIRSALGLREQLFVVERRTDDAGRAVAFTFTGRGWGHGVGLCQVGAYGLARAGWTYDKILKHYYAGIELTKMY